MRRFLSPFVSALSVGITLQSSDGRAKNQWFAFPANAIFETGDTWVADNQRFRLFGMQSCLRGTFFTNAQGQRVDCGEAGVAMLASIIKDLRPLCTVSARSGSVSYVVCIANVTVQGQATRLDLATALITVGYSFAAFSSDGRPVHEPYFIAQINAAQAKRGFHSFTDVPDPNVILLRALRSQAPSPPAVPPSAPSIQTAPPAAAPLRP